MAIYNQLTEKQKDDLAKSICLSSFLKKVQKYNLSLDEDTFEQIKQRNSYGFLTSIHRDFRTYWSRKTGLENMKNNSIIKDYTLEIVGDLSYINLTVDFHTFSKTFQLQVIIIN